MSEVVTTPRAKVKPKTERPRLYKVILINDDFTPREFVVRVLKAVFRMSESQAYAVRSRRTGAAPQVVAVFARDYSKAKEATDPRLRGGKPRRSRRPPPYLLDRAGGVAPSLPFRGGRVAAATGVGSTPAQETSPRAVTPPGSDAAASESALP